MSRNGFNGSIVDSTYSSCVRNISKEPQHTYNWFDRTYDAKVFVIFGCLFSDCYDEDEMDTSTYENPSIIDGLSFNQQMFDHFMAGGHSSGGSLLDVQPSKEGKDKIERCPNFSEVEKTQFIDLFEENKDVLLNNGRKPNLAEMKKEIWDKICLEMNATVSAQLPRTVNQLQTFWKNVSVRTKNKYKDLSPGEYDQLPPLTAKIL
uniref:Regulatory protein zeste n=1 Tax=Romanomermis culicivorax TaxID=13658 RepID=A0A915IZS2_ROMCU